MNQIMNIRLESSARIEATFIENQFTMVKESKLNAKRRLDALYTVHSSVLTLTRLISPVHDLDPGLDILFQDINKLHRDIVSEIIELEGVR